MGDNMTKTLKQTPTPWKAVWDEERETWRIWFKDGDFKDREWEMTPNTIRYQPDIDLIVKAVNTHDELLAQLKHAVGALRFGRKPDECYLKAMEAVIAKAEAK